MPNEPTVLDRVFGALSHPTRRDVLQRLERGPATTTDLASAYDMALPSFFQHLQVLESSGLVTSRKEGRVRTFQLRPQPLLEAEHWMDARKRQWEARLDGLDGLLAALKDQNP